MKVGTGSDDGSDDDLVMDKPIEQSKHPDMSVDVGVGVGVGQLGQYCSEGGLLETDHLHEGLTENSHEDAQVWRRHRELKELAGGAVGGKKPKPNMAIVKKAKLTYKDIFGS